MEAQSAVIDFGSDAHSSRQRNVGSGRSWSPDELHAEWARGDGRNFPPLPPGHDSIDDYRARADALNKLDFDFCNPNAPPKPKKNMFSWITWSPLDFCNWAGTLYSFCVIFALFFANAYFTCPILRGSEEACQAPIFTGYFLLAEIIGNFLLFHYYGRYNRFSKLFPGTLKEDPTGTVTKYCCSCKEVVPRRSHHCPLCKVCVFQKDHHCFLVGGCVGIGNQRYFLGFLLWATLGAGYGTSWVFMYLDTFMKSFLPWGWIDYIGPLALKKWLVWQHISLFHLALVMLFSAGIASTFGAFAFLVSQIYFIASGRTMWEFMRPPSAVSAQKSDGLTVNQRFKMILGPWWLIQFAVPLPLLRNRIDTASLYEIYHSAHKDL